MTQFTPQPYSEGVAAPFVAPQRTPRSMLSVVAIIVAALTFLALVISKVLSAVTLDLDDTVYVVLGVLGLATILPILIVVVLGHMALAATSGGRKSGRASAGAALAIGYVLLVLFVVRLINVATYLSTNSISVDDQFGFFRQIFYWA